MKNIVLKFYIAAFCLCSTSILFAQPGADDTTGTLEGTDAPAPIDNYVWVLALIGLVFIFLKFRAIQKNKIQG
jgi:hypothetical protein